MSSNQYTEGIYLEDGTLKKFKDADLTQKVKELNSNLGSKVIVDGKEIKELRFGSVYYDKDCGELPYEFYGSPAVVYNNEIHILGSSSSDNYTKHYLIRMLYAIQYN